MNNERYLKSVIEVLQHKSSSLQEFLDYALDKAIDLTESKIGYIYYYNEEKKQFVLNSWSKEVMKECRVTNPQSTYELERTGLWGEAIRQRKPIILNDFQSPHPMKKGSPEGHAKLYKFMTIPVFKNDEIVAVVGVANKETDYDETDTLQLTLMMDAVWKVVDNKKSEETLRENEEKFRNLFQYHSAVKLIMDPENGDIVEANKAASEFYGWSIEELKKMKITQINILPVDEIKKQMEMAKNSTNIHFEFKHRKADGTIVDVEVFSSRINIDGKDFLHSIIHDVSDRKRVEIENNRLKDNFLSAFNSSPAASAITRLSDGKILVVNEAYTNIMGYESAEIVNQSVLNFDIYMDSGERKMIINRLLETGILRNYELQVRTKSSEIKTLLLSMEPTIYDNEQTIISTFIDISELKLAEAELKKREKKLQKIFDILPIGIWFADEKGKLVMGNPAGIKIWGAEPKVPIEEYGVFKARRYPSNEEIAPDDWALAHTVREGITIDNEMLEIDAFDGNKKIILNYSAPLLDDSGKVQGAIVINQDITEQKRAEEEKEKLQKQFVQMQKMESIGRLAGGVAHDFNNMLSVIIGRTELALAKIDESFLCFSELKEIKNAAERSANLTAQLLAFARKQVITPKVVLMNEAIEKILVMLKRLIGENIKLKWTPSQNLWQIKIDPTQIDQILVNLCVNAKDAIMNKGKIFISTENVIVSDPDRKNMPGIIQGEFVLLKVRDTGVGMDSEMLNHIFEPFYTTKDLGKGTGLGLSTIYGVVKQNSGFIYVESSLGQGTVFKIYFPRRTDQLTEAENENRFKNPAGTGQTILLVEDEQALLDVGDTMLKSFGYNVLTAASPSEAIRVAVEYPGNIDMIITDIIMPEMNGKDLARKIISMHPGIKCLFMSGYTSDVITDNGIMYEGINFIQKPFSMNALALKVRAVFQQ